MLRLMKNPLFREFADLVIQNRDVVSDAARKWGGRKQKPEEQAAPGFDRAARTAEAEAPQAPPRDETRERLIALETALAETRAAAEAARGDLDEARSKTDDLDARVRAITASMESLVRRLDAVEIRAGSLETALHRTASQIGTLETEAARRGRRYAFGIAALAGWSIVATLAINLLLR